MPGLGQPQAVSIAGIGAQPLVTEATPLSPVVLNAFHNGFITADDIIEKISPQAKAKKKAELTLATEAVSPQAVAARQQTLAAQTAQAQLAQQQATAGLPLVQPQAALAGSKIAAEQQLLPAQTNLTAQQLEMNSQFMYPKALYDIATERLKPVNTIKRVNGSGAEFTQMLNAAGEDVTPGSEAHTSYSRIAQNAFSKLTPGQVQVAPRASLPPPPPIVDPVAAPALGMPGSAEHTPADAARAAVANANPSVPVSAVAQLPDNTAQSAASALVQPKAGAPAPVTVEPANPPGIQTGMSKNFMTAADIGSDLRKQKSYEQWDSQKGFANAFQSTVQDVNNAKPGEPMNTLDMSLAENVIKMFDPTATIRSFKWEKMEEGQPFKERIKNWQQELLRTGTFTPEARQRLIKIGYEQIAGREKGVVPHLQLAAQRAEQSGVTPETVLNPDELRVLHGEGKPGASAPAAAAAPAAKTVNITGLGIGTYDASTGLFTRTQ
jgi:hypothetical protein